MSQWSHPICDECWVGLYGDRVPVRLVEPEPEVCCVCAEPTTSGIYFREDPNMLPAHHLHEEADRA